jgi:hypothetical protein
MTRLREMTLTRYAIFASLMGCAGIAVTAWTDGALETLPLVVCTLCAFALVRRNYRLGA